jgi:N-acetylmuramoyl-L-alanine amidase
MYPVLITAGHSNVDCGAVNATTGDKESDIAVDMRNMVSSYLTSWGVEHITDGTGRDNASLTQAVKLMKGKCIAIEFHCNASVHPTAKGVEALAQYKDAAISQKLCAAVATVMDSIVRGADKGWKSESSGQHHRLAYVSNGGIILEMFFISNPKELSVWKAKKWLVAKAVAKVIQDRYLLGGV